MFPIKSPSECLISIKKRLSREEKTAFLATLLIGFFCHIFIFTNSMYNNDDIRYLYFELDKPELGRWLQTYAAGISSYFSLPVINGLLSLFYTSLASIFLVRIFDLKNRIGIVLMSGLLITFPNMACLYSFMYTADSCMLCCLFSIITAYLITRTEHTWYWTPAAACLCISLGIYQGYLPFTLLLMLLFYILMLLEPENYSDKLLLTMGIRYLLTLTVGLFSYYICMRLTLKIKHTQLSDYKGIGESSFPNITTLKNRLYTLFTDFINFFKPSQVLSFNRWMQLALIMCLILLALFFFTLYGKRHIYKSPLRNILLLFCFICIPLSVNIFYLISDGVTDLHMLMRHAWCLLFIAVIVLYEKGAPAFSFTKRQLLEWASFAALSLVVWNYILLSNIAYFNMNFRYEKTYALCIKIMDRLEQSEDYDNDRPIAFIGNFSKTYKMEALADLLEPMVGTSGPRIFRGASRAYLPFFQNCLGEDITVVTPEEEAALAATPEFQEMPYFPHEGSIRVINDTTVIKLNDG